MAGYLSLSEIRPWWVRLSLLLVLGEPMLTGGSLHVRLHVDHAFLDLGYWTAYAVFIWLFVFLCVGGSRLLAWLAAASVFGLALVMGGATLTKIGVWEFLQGLLGAVGTVTEFDRVQRELDLLFRLLMILTSLPFFLLALQSFSASAIFAAAVRRGASGGNKVLIGLAVFLRLFQHVFELFERFLLAWREENPRMLSPRHAADSSSAFRSLRILEWWKTSLWVWCIALLQHSLLFVPVVVREWQQFLDKDQSHA